VDIRSKIRSAMFVIEKWKDVENEQLCKTADNNTTNEGNHSEDMAIIKVANDAWLKAIDLVMQAVKAYDSARADCYKVMREVGKRRLQKCAIALQEQEDGKPERMEQWRQEEGEILESSRDIVPRIDVLNSMEWKFRY